MRGRRWRRCRGGSTLYLIGGFDPTTGNRPVASTYSYDPATDTWVGRAPTTVHVNAPRGVGMGDTLYAIGGASPAGDTGTTEAYDPAADTWRTDPAPMPTPREHLASALLNGLIHVVGGRSPAPGKTGTTHEVYEPIANT